MTLTEFLMARIAEDEAAVVPEGSPMAYPARPVNNHMARQDGRERLQAVALGIRCPTCHAETGATCRAMTPPHHAPKPAADLHATRMDLARAEYRRQYGVLTCWNGPRVLAECAAKRRIVKRLIHAASLSNPEEFTDADRVLIDTLRDLAAVYADHPDLRKEWLM